MAIERYSLRGTPILSARLITGDTVTVSIYEKDGTPVALDSNSATENVASSGKYDYELDFTTVPISGINYYDIKFTGALQTVWKSFTWDEQVSEFNNRVTVDVVNGVSGQKFPIGCIDTPSNNLADAKAIADRNSLTMFHVKGSLTLDRDMSGYQFKGDSVNSDDIALANQNVAGCNFYDLSIAGQMNASTAVYCDSCYLNDVSDFNGVVENVAVNTGLSIRVGGTFNGNRVYGNSQTTAAPIFDFQDSNTTVMGLAGFEGLIEIQNMAVGSLCLLGGNSLLEVDSTCVGGIILISGHQGAAIDNSGVGCIVLDYRDSGHADMQLTLADTNELQTDWTDGGRLDVIQDAIKTVTDNLPNAGALTSISGDITSILSDTTFLEKLGLSEWELVAPNKLYFYEQGTRTGPGAGTILFEGDCTDSAGNPTITDIARVESV